MKYLLTAVIALCQEFIFPRVLRSPALPIDENVQDWYRHVFGLNLENQALQPLQWRS